MSTRTLFRFASVRSAARRTGSPILLVCPTADKPANKFEISLAGADSFDTTRKLAADFRKSEAYLGSSLDKLGPLAGWLMALPRLLQAARSANPAPVIDELAKSARPRNATPDQEIQLWDSFIAAALSAAPDQEIADLADAIRVNAALNRAASRDIKQVAAALRGYPVLPTWALSKPAKGSPADRGIVPAGVADLLIVKDRLLGYQRTELSYIETVMRGEKKQRTHRKLDRTYDSLSITDEEAEETTRDTQTTNRSEMVSETQQTLNTAMSISTGLQISASFGPVVSTDTSIDASFGTSEENSISSSNTMAQDIVDRSASTITQRTVTTTIQRRLSETEETNLHSLENQTNAHTNGLYRWLEQVWEAQVVNYGKRLMIEIMVPEPAALWRKANRESATRVNVPAPPKLGDLAPTKINESNYSDLIRTFNPNGVTPPPPASTVISKSFEFQEREHQKDLPKNDFAVQTKVGMIQIPGGFKSREASVGRAQIKWEGTDGSVAVTFGPREITLPGDSVPFDVKGLEGSVDVAIVFKNFPAGVVTLTVWCDRTPESFASWQIDTYQKIVAAQQKAAEAYQAALDKGDTESQSAQLNLPADQKRLLEKTELKRSALCILMDQDLSKLDAVSTPQAPGKPPVIDNAEALREGRRVLFYENSFDWDQMTYVFYPYFWGRQQYWFDVLDYTDTDPVFESFLRAGSARVQIPVRPGFENAVLFYLNTGEIWFGGSAPVIGDPLYLPISTEIAESKDQPIDQGIPYGEPWKYTIPTSLVMLDDDAKDIRP